MVPGSGCFGNHNPLTHEDKALEFGLSMGYDMRTVRNRSATRTHLVEVRFMKTAVVIVLIIGGVILILAPVVADQVHEAHLVQLLDKPGISNVTLQVQMSSEYKFGCWATGSTMIGVSVVLTVLFNWQTAWGSVTSDRRAAGLTKEHN